MVCFAKKTLSICFLLLVLAGQLFAEEVRTFDGASDDYEYSGTTREFEDNRYTYDNSLLSTWDFDTEIGSYVGFNIDQRALGMQGLGKISLESVIHPEGDEEFYQEGIFYGKIVVEDLEIKSYLDEATLSDNASQEMPLNISWGDIEGTVFLGPFYMNLAYNNHDRLDLVDTLDDDDLDFSVINYSLVSLQDTATYTGSNDSSVGGVVEFSIDDDRGLAGRDFIENTYGAFTLGYNYENWFDIRAGFSTQANYLNKIDKNYNPFALSLAMTLLLEDYKGYSFFTINMKSSASSGVSGREFLEEDNPAFFGVSAQYRIPLFNGQFGLSPLVGAEIELEFEQVIDPNATFQGNTAKAENNKWVLSQTYEAVTGVVFDWKEKGVSKDEDDYLEFRSGSNDIVTDGVSATLGFGYMPNDIFRFLQTPYIGLKVALWESESSTAKGLIPYLQTAFLMNINHSFGGTLNDFHTYIDGYENLSSSSVVVGERTDFGIGGQIKTNIAFLRPYVNVFFTNLDIFSSEDKYVLGEIETLEGIRYYDNKADLRAKIGFEAVGIIHRVILETYWESGDMIKGSIEDGELTDDDFFTAEDVSGESIFVSNAKYGYISIGAKVKF